MKTINYEKIIKIILFIEVIYFLMATLIGWNYIYKAILKDPVLTKEIAENWTRALPILFVVPIIGTVVDIVAFLILKKKINIFRLVIIFIGLSLVIPIVVGAEEFSLMHKWFTPSIYILTIQIIFLFILHLYRKYQATKKVFGNN